MGLAAYKAPADDEEAEPDDKAESKESSEDEYGDVLADILGVSEDDRQNFMDALHGYVRACVKAEK